MISRALVQDGFLVFQGGQVRALPQQADGDFFSPLKGKFHGRLEVRGIMPLFLDLFDIAAQTLQPISRFSPG